MEAKFAEVLVHSPIAAICQLAGCLEIAQENCFTTPRRQSYMECVWHCEHELPKSSDLCTQSRKNSVFMVQFLKVRVRRVQNTCDKLY